jgi:hypothetical protein
MAVIAPIIQTLISVAAALFGIWLGTRLSRKKDQQQWRRDRCLEAYTDLLRACSVVLDYGMVDWIKQAGGTERLADRDSESHMDLVTKNSRALYHALDRVRLLAPIEVSKCAQELADHSMKFIQSSGVYPPSGEEWTKIGKEYSILYDKFKDAARNELLKH